LFTGITTDIGEVLGVREQAEGLRRLTVACRYDRASIAIGASIAHSGVCLTVVETGEQDGRTAYAVDAAAETLRMTTAGAWQAGTRLNLERALKVGDELGGHIVAGHADGIAELTAREDLPGMARLTLTASRSPSTRLRPIRFRSSSSRTRFRSPCSAPPRSATA
jgi:riboflavin synthase